MIEIGCKNLHKSFGIDIILNNVTFNINEGDKVGLVGKNGAGKSTIFKILSNRMSYDSGDVFIDKNKKIGYLSQNLSLNSENTVYDEVLSVFDDLLKLEEKLRTLEENLNTPYDITQESYHDKLIKQYTTATELYNNRGGYTYKGEIHKVLTGLGFVEEDFPKKINLLSGGQKTRVALCKLLLEAHNILLLDEPTNHLDLSAIEWLEDYLKNYKGTIIIISHDRYFLDSITNKTFELINGSIETYAGNYSEYIKLKKKRYEDQLKAYNLQQAEIKRQEEIIKKYRSFNREKSIRAAESRQKALDKIEIIDAPDKETKIHKITFKTYIRSGYDVLHLEGLSKSYDNNTLFKNVNLDIKKGDKVALIGENGRGKTTLFKIILSELQEFQGVRYLGKNVFPGYYEQEQSDLDPTKTILDEVWDTFPEMTTTEIRNALAAFLFTGDDVFKTIDKLSGGEKCKINILKLMLSKSNFLLLDEPTNHLDIMSREALEDALLEYDGTLLIISHDRYFLNKVINRICELEELGINEYLGNYDYYVEKKKNPERYAQEKLTAGKTKTEIQLERKKKKALEKQEKEHKKILNTLEVNISNLEENLQKLENDLCLEEIYSNPEKSEQVSKEISETKNKLQQLYDEWERIL